jgi:hypothetical protein
MQFPLHDVTQYLPLAGELPARMPRPMRELFSDDLRLAVGYVFSILTGMTTTVAAGFAKLEKAAATAAGFSIFFSALACIAWRVGNQGRPDPSAGNVEYEGAKVGWRGFIGACMVGAFLTAVLCIALVLKTQTG